MSCNAEARAVGTYVKIFWDARRYGCMVGAENAAEQLASLGLPVYATMLKEARKGVEQGVMGTGSDPERASGWDLDEDTARENAESQMRVKEEVKAKEADMDTGKTEEAKMEEGVRADRIWRKWAEEKKKENRFRRGEGWKNCIVVILPQLNPHVDLMGVRSLSEACKDLEAATQAVRKDEKTVWAQDKETQDVADHHSQGRWVAESEEDEGLSEWNPWWSDSGWDSDGHYIPARRRSERGRREDEWNPMQYRNWYAGNHYLDRSESDDYIW